MNSHPAALLFVAEIWMEEAQARAEHDRLKKQTASLSAGRDRRGFNLRAEVMALRARISAKGGRSGSPNPIDLASAAPETTSAT